MAIRMISSHLFVPQRMLGACTNVHAGGGSSQKAPLNERNQDGVARVGVKTPESLRLCFGKLQAWHLVVLALDSLNQGAARLLSRGR
jgi:hypothetical protein